MSFLGYFAFSILLGRNFVKLNLKEQEIAQQKFYNSAMSNLIDELRTFKHGVDNTLASIQGYVKQNDLNSLSIFLDELIQNSNDVNYTESILYQYVKNPGLAGLIQSKINTMRLSSITLNLQIENNIEQIDCKINDLCEILGIIIDNAIESAIESNNKKIKLHISNNNESISFTLDNSTNTPPNLSKIFEKGFSTKGNQRGLGLWILKQVIKKYKNIIYNIFVEDDMVRQELIIHTNSL